MKAIHVLRKPCSESTVVANVRTHGCGGLNIDASRISTAGEEIKQVQSDPTNRTGTVGRDLGFTGAAVDAFREAQRASIERANRMGRWPTNVVFQHLEGCVQDGTRAVRSNGHYPASRSGGSTQYMGGHAGQTGLTERRMDGETLTQWSCAPSCPVAALDAQGGNSTSPSMVTRGGLRGMAFGMGRQEDVPCYGDTGGASRFFKQFVGKPE